MSVSKPWHATQTFTFAEKWSETSTDSFSAASSVKPPNCCETPSRVARSGMN